MQKRPLALLGSKSTAGHIHAGDDSVQNPARETDNTFAVPFGLAPRHPRDWASARRRPSAERLFSPSRCSKKRAAHAIAMDSASNATLTPTGDALSAKDPHDVWVAVLGNALVFCIFLGLSADVNIVDFKSKFSFQSNQWRALFAGICCQFFIMPLIGFSIVNIFSLSEARGIILLVVASSPGGAFSNWWCNLFNADLALSIAMTTCSTLLSLGLLPLNTFVFVTLSFGTNVPVNYVALGVTCGLVLVGTATGLAAGHLFPGCKYVGDGEAGVRRAGTLSMAGAVGPRSGKAPGHVGFSLVGWGGGNRAPNNWGGGVWEKGSIDRPHYPVIMNSGAEHFFEH